MALVIGISLLLVWLGLSLATGKFLKKFDQHKFRGFLVSLYFMFALIGIFSLEDVAFASIVPLLLLLLLMPVVGIMRIILGRKYVKYQQVQSNLTKVYTMMASMVHLMVLALFNKSTPVEFVMVLISLALTLFGLITMLAAIFSKNELKKLDDQKSEFDNEDYRIKGPNEYVREDNLSHDEIEAMNDTPQPIYEVTSQAQTRNKRILDYDVGESDRQEESEEDLYPTHRPDKPIDDTPTIFIEKQEGLEGDALININTCSEMDMMKLPGLTMMGVKKLINHRHKAGQFKSLDQVVEIADVASYNVERLLEQIKIG